MHHFIIVSVQNRLDMVRPDRIVFSIYPTVYKILNRPNGPLGDCSVSTGYDMTDALAPEIILNFIKNKRSCFVR